MLVKKSVMVDVGQGTPEDIGEALVNITLPDKARLVGIETNAYDIESDAISIYRTHHTKLKFEWMDEE